MAKGKSKLSKEEKRRKKARKGAVKPPTEFDGPGDLRAVEYHVDQWSRGVEEGLNMLLMLGRDASFIVERMAKERGTDELKDLARRLVATRPRMESNLYELRAASVNKLVDDAFTKAPNAVDIGEMEIAGGTLGIFDPKRLAEKLARGGRARKDPAQLNAGDLAAFGLETFKGVNIRFTTNPVEAGQRALQLRLAVDSGVVFVGPAQASDGPRMGTLRLDPFTTTLDQYVNEGRFLRIKPDVYRVFAIPEEGGGVTVHLNPDPNPEEDLQLDPKHLTLRMAVDVGRSEG